MKVRVLGRKGCSRCEMIKKVLDNNGIEFDYCLLEELTKEELNMILDLAKEKGEETLPILMVDSIIKTLQEVLS